MRHYLGLDAGGTKTLCLIGDEKGNIEGFGRGGCGNYELCGVDAARKENQKAVAAALDDAALSLSDISAVGMGVAGADLPEDFEMLEREIYADLFGNLPRAFHNDAVVGLRGGTRNPCGIVVAVGTGCICAGRDHAGRTARSGGLSEKFGDEYTGAVIGRLGLNRVWQARDGIIEETLLTKLFVDRAGCRDVEDLFRKLYREEISLEDLQPMAKLVFDAAFEGDSAACGILTQAGRYFGAMVNAVARKLDMTNTSFDLVMAGSVFKGSSPVLKDAMSAAVHAICPRARPIMPAFEPIVGALLLGIELDSTVSDALYENLSVSLSECEKRCRVKLKSE
jgi:N-acetylglucosamine kinase-like BadF-type ATPase